MRFIFSPLDSNLLAQTVKSQGCYRKSGQTAKAQRWRCERIRGQALADMCLLLTPCMAAFIKIYEHSAWCTSLVFEDLRVQTLLARCHFFGVQWAKCTCKATCIFYVCRYCMLFNICLHWLKQHERVPVSGIDKTTWALIRGYKAMCILIWQTHHMVSQAKHD